MDAKETDLEMVQRHVRQGERHLANQRALIARLKTSGLPTDDAEATLDLFNDVQCSHQDHCKRLEGKHAPGGVQLFGGSEAPGLKTHAREGADVIDPDPIDEARRQVAEARAMRAEAARQRERLGIAYAQVRWFRGALHAQRIGTAAHADEPAGAGPSSPSETA